MTSLRGGERPCIKWWTERIFEERNVSFGAIVSEVISVVGHARAAVERIEATNVRTTSDSDQHAANVIVPRVVTPQYVRTSCALNARNASLGSAPRFLLDVGTSERGAIRLTVH